MSIKELVKNKVVSFDSFRQGFFYYNVYDPNETPTGEVYQFTVPLEDIGSSTLLRNDKAITFMRWIRKAQESGELIKIR